MNKDAAGRIMAFVVMLVFFILMGIAGEVDRRVEMEVHQISGIRNHMY